MTSSPLRRPRILAVFAAILLSPGLQAADIFVDASATSGTNDGRDWQNAFLKLQDAITAAADGDVIWVAEGIYYPDEGVGIPGNDPGISFAVRKKISIYGGFESGAESLEESDPLGNLTILSGDIDQNDGDTNGDGIPNTLGSLTGNNAETVLLLVGLTDNQVFSGLYVVAGDGTSGCGVTSTNSSHRWVDCYVRYHRATGNGGGMLIDGGGPRIEGGQVSDNEADQGGGVYVQGADVVLDGVDIDRNFASPDGGGLYASESDLVMAGVDFRLNVANRNGGGVYFLTTGSHALSMDQCRMERNSSTTGRGAGLFQEGGTLDAVNCQVRGNSAGLNGGGMLLDVTSAALTNLLVTGNSAGVTGAGGGISNSTNSPTTVTNCTFAGNRARSFAAYLGGNTDFVNTIAWDNDTTIVAGSPDVTNSALNTFSHCLLEGEALPGGGNNLDGTSAANDPQFIAPSTAMPPTSDGDYNLAASSPCVDRGDNAAYSGPGEDLLFGVRFFDADLNLVAEIDLGPLETTQTNNLDSDMDGLPNSYEALNTTPSSTTSLAALGDPDEDGRNTLLEFATGTDPNVFDPGSPLTIVIDDFARPVLNHTVSNFAMNFVDLVLVSSTDLGQADDWGPAAVTQGTTMTGGDVDVVVSTATHTTAIPATQYRLEVSKK